jgi:hypothetical protein
LYAIQVDDGPRVAVRPDTGTSAPDIDLSLIHRVVLSRAGHRVAAARMRFDPERLCLGLSNYSGTFSEYDYDLARCG